MRILVTGGAGFIGSRLVKRLVSDGHHVRVIDNGYRGNRILPSEVDFRIADVRQRIDAEGCDTIVHLADVNGTERFYDDPQLVLDVALRGMQGILKACKAYNIQNLFVASSSEVYHDPGIFPTPETVPLIIPDPLNPRYSYACGKIVKEMMTLHSGLERAVVFRPHNIYGPDMGEEHVIPQLVRKIQRGRLSLKGGGQQTRSFCHIDDFVNALTVLMVNGVTGVYHIGNPEEVGINRLAGKIVDIMDADPEISGPDAEFAGETTRRKPDISKMKALGWSPQIMLDDGLPETVKWYQEY